MKKTLYLWILLTTIFMMLTAVESEALWINPPNVFNNYFNVGVEGPDGILGTPDDLPMGGMGIFSGYVGGTYIGPAGVQLTANVSMRSIVGQIADDKWSYYWEITNTGTGPFVKYVDTGNGPNFLQLPPLFGTAGVDRLPMTNDDVAPETEVDTRIGGRPTIGFWGGTWNPEMPPEAMRYEPVPEPSTLLLISSGIASIILLGKKRVLKKK